MLSIGLIIISVYARPPGARGANSVDLKSSDSAAATPVAKAMPAGSCRLGKMAAWQRSACSRCRLGVLNPAAVCGNSDVTSALLRWRKGGHSRRRPGCCSGIWLAIPTPAVPHCLGRARPLGAEPSATLGGGVLTKTGV